MYLLRNLAFILLAVITNSVTASSKIIQCYYGTWATYRPSLGKFDVEHIDTSLCTHVVYAFVGINGEGNVISLDPYLDLPDNWGRNNFAKFNALKIGKPNLKTILAVGGWNEGSAKYSKMAASPTLRQNFISSAIKIIRGYGFDGLNVDWEYPNRRDTVHGAADKQNFVQLLKELRNEFDKYGLELSAAVGAVADTASQSYDIPNISKYLDHIDLMTYDMYGPWDPVTGHNSPLHRGEGDGNVPKEQLYTVDVAIDYWIKNGCPPEKLLLGLPLYGHTFTLTSASVNGVRAPSSGAGFSGPYTATSGIVGYNEFCDMLRTQSWNLKYDSMAKVPYAVQGRNWVSYDDPASLTAKVEYGLKQNIGGIMIWSIETDDFRNVCGSGKFPLLQSISKALGNQSSNSTLSTTTTSAAPVTTTTISSTTPKTSTTTKPTTISSTQSTTQSTVEATTVASSVCKSEGLTANPEDCTSFFMCSLHPNGKFVAYKFKCPSNLYWDDKNLYCNYPDQVECNVQV